MKLRNVLAILLSAALAVGACTGKPKKAETVTQQKAVISEEAFFDASFTGNFEVVRAAIEGGSIEVDKANPDGATALLLAAFNGHTNTVDFLLKKGANVNHYDSNHRSALMYSASGPFPEAVKMLLDAGADINAVDSVEQFSAVMFAAAEGQLDVVKLLHEKGADINAVDIDNESSLDFARSNGHNAVMEYLMGQD